jgi:hypothetical protein
MAKKTSPTTSDQIFSELERHYQVGFDETDRRRTGKGLIGSISFDEADELFRSWLNENDWPYDALLFDPRVFTFIFEKTARLIGSRLRGELIPREGGDVIGAKINNALLNYQWDQASHGGSMLSKWALMDINTRKYGAAFGLCKWRYERDKNDKAVFDGPEMYVLNNRDCASDLSGNSVETLNWFDARQYVTLQELKRVNDVSRGKPIYENLDKLYTKVEEDIHNEKGGDSRDSNWISRNRTISGLHQSPIGNDPVFKHVEIVTEYRRDEWLTFAPKHGVVLRVIDNPYKNHEIPITMLRYYPIDDDLYGLSEIEPIKGLQKGINALLCQYVDEINQKLYSPVAIGPGVRQQTLQWGKGARWIMNNPMSDFRVVESSSNAAAYFNNTYSALVAAMMNALGESSLGISNIDRFQGDKTATEVKQLTLQRNARDNFNQLFLAESIERQMKLWHSMNQQMIFSEGDKSSYILRIVGNDLIKQFQEAGFDKYGISEGAGDMLSDDLDVDPEKMRAPVYPVDISGENGEEKIVPKFDLEKSGKFGKLYIEPSDLMGNYDYVADVRSMTVNAGEEEKSARDRAITALLSNQNVLALLQQEGYSPKFKDLFVAWLEDYGFKDADKFFEKAPPQQGGEIPGQPGRPNMPDMKNRIGTMSPQAGPTAPQMPPINLNTVNPGELMHLANPNIYKENGAVGVGQPPMS